MATLRQVWMLFAAFMYIYEYVTLTKGTSAVSIEEKIRSEIFSGYSILQRPVSNLSKPIIIAMSMGFATMHNFIEKQQVLSFSAHLQMRWTDHRLKWNPADHGGVELIPVRPSEVWLPKLTVFNGVSREGLNVVDKDIGEILLKFDGEVNLGMPFQQSTECPIRVLYFPFDKQSCPFVFGFQNLPHTFGQLEILGAYLLTSPTGGQWNVTSISGEVTQLDIPNVTSAEEKMIFSEAVFTIFLERDPRYYIATLIIPSTCLCLLAFMTFLAPPDSGERISVSVSMVLGMTVFQLLMFDLLPISNEQCLLSNHLLWNFILVTLTVPSTLMSINLACGDLTESLLKKRWFRVLMLELLSKVLFVPSLSKRLQKNNVLPQKPTLEGIADGAFDETTEQGKNVTVVSPGRNPNKEDRDRQTDILESRTLALVYDRLMFLLLLICLAVQLIRLVFNYSNQDIQVEIS